MRSIEKSLGRVAKKKFQDDAEVDNYHAFIIIIIIISKFLAHDNDFQAF